MACSIGFIGLGIMGAPMARRLLVAGHRLTVYNRTAARAEPLVAAGARAAGSPRACAEGNDVVISIVTDSPDVEEVLLGPQGAVHGARPGALFVDMSTIAPATARRVSAALLARGIRFLDAPVTGGDVGARNGTLSILVGGDAADLERARPIFEALGKRITLCGPPGAGQIVKACNQILCAMNLIGVSEALLLARRHGVDPALVVEALSAGAGGSWSLANLGPKIIAGDFAPAFMIDLIQKDLRIVQEAAGVPLEGTALAQKLFAEAQRNGDGRSGTQAVYKVVEARGGRSE
jgi:3-hydroxyisobutyrate dehydrogenase